jgi:hypothetical protein
MVVGMRVAPLGIPSAAKAANSYCINGTAEAVPFQISKHIVAYHKNA